MVDLLEVPFVFTGFGVEGDDRGREQVFAFAVAAEPRRRVRGREVQHVVVRVDGRGVPDRGAAFFVGAVVGPRVAAVFLRAGRGPEAPFDLARFGVERGQTTADAVLAAGTADVHLAVVVERRTGDREAFL